MIIAGVDGGDDICSLMLSFLQPEVVHRKVRPGCPAAIWCGQLSNPMAGGIVMSRYRHAVGDIIHADDIHLRHRVPACLQYIHLGKNLSDGIRQDDTTACAAAEFLAFLGLAWPRSRLLAGEAGPPRNDRHESETDN